MRHGRLVDVEDVAFVEADEGKVFRKVQAKRIEGVEAVETDLLCRKDEGLGASLGGVTEYSDDILLGRGGFIFNPVETGIVQKT